MKRKLLVLAIVVIAAGFWRGWVVLSGHREPATRKVDVNLTIDPDKLKEDANRVEGKAVELKDKVRDEFRRD